MQSEMPSASQGTGNAPLNKESAPLVYPTRVRALLGLPDRSDGITPSAGPMLSQEFPYVGQDADEESSEQLDAGRESTDSKFEWPEPVEESALTTPETVMEEDAIGEQTNLMIPGISKPQNFSALETVELSQTPFSLLNTAEISRHSGMDRRNPDCMDAFNFRHPSSLISCAPCRNDEEKPNLTALPLPLPQAKEDGDKPNPVDMQREINRDKPRPLPHTPFKEGDEGEFLADDSGKLTGQMPETVVARPLRLRSGQAYSGLHPNLATTALPLPIPQAAEDGDKPNPVDTQREISQDKPRPPSHSNAVELSPYPHPNPLPMREGTLEPNSTTALPLPLPQAEEDGDKPNPVDTQREISRNKSSPPSHTNTVELSQTPSPPTGFALLTSLSPQAGEVGRKPLSPEGRGVGERGFTVLQDSSDLNSTALPSHAPFKEEGFLADVSGKLTGQMPETVVVRPLRLRSGQAYPGPHSNLNSAATPSLSMPMPQSLNGEMPNPTAMKEAGNRPSMPRPASAEPAMVPVDAIYSAIERSPPEFRVRTKPPADSPPVFTGQISPVPAFTGPVIHEDALPRSAPVTKFMPSDHSFPELDLAGTTKQPLKAMAEQIAQLQLALTDLTHQLDGQRARQQETTFIPPPQPKLNEVSPRSNAQSGHAFWERSYLNRSYRWSLR